MLLCELSVKIRKLTKCSFVKISSKLRYFVTLAAVKNGSQTQ